MHWARARCPRLPTAMLAWPSRPRIAAVAPVKTRVPVPRGSIARATSRPTRKAPRPFASQQPTNAEVSMPTTWPGPLRAPLWSCPMSEAGAADLPACAR